MKPIKYNRFINRIGIEFEGFYEPHLLTQLSSDSDFVSDITNDGSLVFSDNIPGDYKSKEVKTKPLTSPVLTKSLAFMGAMMKKGLYLLNDTCGLHYHISVRPAIYGRLCSLEFYQAYVKLFSSHFKRVYHRRKQNRYCSFSLTTSRYGTNDLKKIEKKHFTRSSYQRFHAINYCYDKHKTIEFRGYGGSCATLGGLAHLIQLTIDLIGEFAKRPLEIKKSYTNEHKQIKCRYLYFNGYRRRIDDYFSFPGIYNFKSIYNFKIPPTPAKKYQEINITSLEKNHSLPLPFQSGRIEITI